MVKNHPFNEISFFCSPFLGEETIKLTSRKFYQLGEWQVGKTLIVVKSKEKKEALTICFLKRFANQMSFSLLEVQTAEKSCPNFMSRISILKGWIMITSVHRL